MIYMDNAATTKISEPVLKAMMPYLYEQYGNASSPYELGTKSRDAINQARKYVAELINAEPDEIYFTSGGSEANNWAIKGLNYGKVTTSMIEHPSVLRTVESLIHGETSVEFLPVDQYGTVLFNQLTKSLESPVDGKRLVSIMFANNEIGTIQPIEQIGAMCRDSGALFHTDAVQAFGQIPIDVKAMNIDMLSASGHKIHAPKGIGCLYMRNGIQVTPFILGGHQEGGMRAGTENVASIVAFGEAAYQAKRTMKKRMKKVSGTREYIRHRLVDEIQNCFINGNTYIDDDNDILPGNISITFAGIDGESLVLMLSRCKEPICISAGSACSSGSAMPSHVLKASGLPDEMAYGTVRLSIDETLKLDEANYAIESIKKCVETLRSYK